MGRKNRKPPSDAPSRTPSDPVYYFWKEEWSLLRTAAAEVWQWKGVIVSLLLLSLFSRFFMLSKPSLWMDEIVILQEAFAGKYQLVSYRTHWAHLEPARFFMHLFGQTAFGVRFWGALLGSLAVPLLCVWGILAWRGVFGFLVGVFALTNCFLIMYAQDGNYYGGMTFYIAVQLIGYTLLFRGMPHLGFAVVAAAGAISFKNHPISALPTAIMLGGMVIGTLAFSSVRNRLFAWHPKRWFGLPALPLLLIALLAASPKLAKMAPQVGKFLSESIEPGASTLTNVSFGLPIFVEHLRSLLINFHRPESYQGFFLILPLLFLLLGLASLALHRDAQKRLPFVALAGLVIVAPLASYVLLFSLKMNRNFNLRYFIYLVPLLLAAIGAGMTWLVDVLGRRKDSEFPFRLALAAASPLLLLNLFFSGSYLLQDTSNYRKGAEQFASNYHGEDIIVPSRNDLVESRYFLGLHDLPSKPPTFSHLNLGAFGDQFAAPLPVLLNGEDDVAILSAWRYVEAPRLYDFLSRAMPPEFEGTDRFSVQHDLRIHRWTFGSRVLYPNLAAHIDFDEGEHTVVAGRGSWRVNDSPSFPEGSLDTSGVEQLKRSTPASGSAHFIPVLPDVDARSYHDAVNFPEHTRFRESTVGDTPVLRTERDGSYDFLLYQPEAEVRTLVVKVARRDPSDVPPEQAPIPEGLLVGIAIDGRHAGFWRIDSGAPEVVRLPVELQFSPGNHRVTISGLMPRSDYTPVFNWEIAGIEWVKDFEGTKFPSLEAEKKLQLSPGWTSLPRAGEPGGAITWVQGGAFTATVDNDLRGPARDPAIRIDMPSGSKDAYQLHTPPMPVQPGTLATYWFYVKPRGLEEHEITPIHIFTDARGNRVGGAFHANGGNIRGTTYGKGWIRRQVTVPVPEGAAFMIGGIQMYHLPKGQKSEGAVVWLASFASPGVEAKFDDPALPASYFEE